MVAQQRPYADDEELQNMELCNARCIEVLDEFIGLLPHQLADRAIDIAGGDGRLSTGLLMKKYGTVDLIDICGLGVQRAKNAMNGHPACGLI